jgi:hypothetical protein
MARQSLTHHTAGCFTCGASVDARNALAWAHNHANRNPGHQVELALGYAITADSGSYSAAPIKDQAK